MTGGEGRVPAPRTPIFGDARVKWFLVGFVLAGVVGVLLCAFFEEGEKWAMVVGLVVAGAAGTWILILSRVKPHFVGFVTFRVRSADPRRRIKGLRAKLRYGDGPFETWTKAWDVDLPPPDPDNPLPLPEEAFTESVPIGPTSVEMTVLFVNADDPRPGVPLMKSREVSPLENATDFVEATATLLQGGLIEDPEGSPPEEPIVVLDTRQPLQCNPPHPQY